jgi:Rps23 Pro-64 3,4-dihydroxylase Tpa1-like proline 4-hydroxylase
MNRQEIADLIMLKLGPAVQDLKRQWDTSGRIRHCVIDDLLPEAVALRIRSAYPAGSGMKTRRSLRELKHIAAQMDRYDPILEEALYAFQDPRVVQAVAEITLLRELEPDSLLYAGGISLMSRGHFLNPHIDNSHDKARERYRVLNLLYYVSPDWSVGHGGHLELWPEGVEHPQITIQSRFNRLAIMVTNRHSWHSVSPVLVTDERCCVSNYYFSPYPADDGEYFHVTSFRGRPEQRLRDWVLRADAALRMGLRKLFPRGVVQTKHFYDKSDKGW